MVIKDKFPLAMTEELSERRQTFLFVIKYQRGVPVASRLKFHVAIIYLCNRLEQLLWIEMGIFRET